MWVVRSRRTGNATGRWADELKHDELRASIPSVARVWRSTTHLALALALVKRLTKITLRPVLQATRKRPLQDLRKPAEVVNYDSSNHSTFNMKALIGIARKWSLILKRRFDKLQVHTFFYKNIIYKNIEAEICQILRIFLRINLRLRFGKGYNVLCWNQ